MSKWIKKSVDSLKDVPSLESFSIQHCTLVIDCNFEDVSKRILFESYLSFRAIDEGDALKTLCEQDFDGKTWLFFALASEFIDWFNSQSSNIRKGTFKHYIIVTQEEIIEILSEDDPIITSI